MIPNNPVEPTGTATNMSILLMLFILETVTQSYSQVELPDYGSDYDSTLDLGNGVMMAPVGVSDETWSTILEGEWMVEFMAPWCPACQSFAQPYSRVAGWSMNQEIQVGVVDVTENPVLSGRFLVTTLPTIYHVKDGIFRRYMGTRDANSLIHFLLEKKWDEVDAVSTWFNPSYPHMGAVGLFFKLSMVVRKFYNMMVTDYGIPEWGCYVIFAVSTIVVGLLLGVFLVFFCDFMFPPKTSRRPFVKEESPCDDKDVDILDDTKTADTDSDNARTTRKRTTVTSPENTGND